MMVAIIYKPYFDQGKALMIGLTLAWLPYEIRRSPFLSERAFKCAWHSSGLSNFAQGSVLHLCERE